MTSKKKNNHQSFRGFAIAALLLALPASVAFSQPAIAQDRAGSRNAAAPAGNDLEAKKLLDKGTEYISVNETDRGVKMIETVIDQYPTSTIRFHAYITLAKYYISVHDYAKAVGYLRNCKQLDNPDKPPTGDLLDLYLESLYLTGVANFQMRAYNSAFPPLRKITIDYPNTVWANQAHYYIGMCHFAQENWTKAIESLSLVGTFVDPASPTAEFVEAGRRFYVKVEDADLPVLIRQGDKVTVTVETSISKDKKTIELVPLAGSDSIYIGSIPTELGEAKPDDGVLHVLAGDTITTTYIDKNTKDGKSNVPRVSVSKVVSTANVLFTLGDLETKTNVVYLSEPIFISVMDSDMDKEPNTLSVKLQSRTKEVDDGSAASIAASVGAGDQQRYKIRDEITVKLTETGKHTGKFTASVPIRRFVEDQPIDKSGSALTCALNDEVIATYIDELHIGGASPREATDSVIVASDISSSPHTPIQVVGDPIIAVKKNLVEATAYLELGKIFKSMGLIKQGKDKSKEGLDRIDSILRTRAIPTSLTQQAFKLKWELQLVKDDYVGAIATCELFNRLFPESPFVDQALMGIGKVKVEDKKYTEAMDIYRRVLSLPNSQVKAEAQFHIAECTELTTKPGSEAAVAQYKLVAERYRDSEFAGEALAKMIDYYIDKKDFAMANDMLTQVFQDYPDGKFLDAMLLKWVMVSYRMGDYQKSFDKCQELMFQYPDSPFAARAQQILPNIEKKLKSGAPAPAAAAPAASGDAK